MLYKGDYVYLRLLEPEDYVNTYCWRNNYDMQRMTCGPVRFVSREMEKNWTARMSQENGKNIYLAICLIENDQMIGWYSINDIDHRNQKCHCGGVVIGEKEYQDGLAYMEADNLAFRYIMNELNVNRITASCLREHVLSRANMEAGFWKLEGIERQSLYKNGIFHDVCHYAFLRSEYMEHLKNGDFEVPRIKRLAKAIKKVRLEVKSNN